MAARAGVSFVALFAVGTLTAAADAGVVAGKLERPPGTTELPARGKAFLPRLENPHAPLETVDPLPAMVVVLEPAPGTIVPPTKPATVLWDLLGDSFARPLVAARLGQPIEIRNSGRASPILAAKNQPALLARKPLNPTDRVGIEPKDVGLIDLADETTPHVRGRMLVVGATSLVALPDAAGRFEFPDVPAGEWTLRVYYAPREPAPPAPPIPTGWIDRTDDKLTVGAKRLDVAVKLPPALPVKP